MTEEAATKTEPKAEPYRGKYTEEELRTRGIGKYVGNRDYGYDTKKRTYLEEGVWTAFSKLRSSMKPIVTDDLGYVFHELGEHTAQIRIDTFLIHRAQGKSVSIPQPVVPQNALVKPDAAVAGKSKAELVLPLFNIEDFGDNAEVEIDTFRDLNWIYKNIAVKNVKPSDAPSPGAFAHLQYIQLNEQNMLDFYTKVYPRLIPAKSQLEGSKFNDDSRTIFSILERLSRESSDSQG